MPTSPYRIICTLPQHVFEVIDRFAKLQKRSKGSVVSEIVQTIYEPLMRTVALMEAARDSHPETLLTLRNTLDDIERELVGATGSGIAQLDWITNRIGEESAKATAKESAHKGSRGVKDVLHQSSAKTALTPRTCNTGVPNAKKGKKGQVRGSKNG